MLTGVAAYLLCSVLALAPVGHASGASRPAPGGTYLGAAVQPPLAAASPIESGHVGRLVSVTAADIDGDGDLDVLALDASLHLLIWTNDGEGHLTRELARPPTVGRTLTRPPLVSGQPIDVIRATGSDDTLWLPDRMPKTTFHVRGHPESIDPAIPSSIVHGYRASRAPPRTLFLA